MFGFLTFGTTLTLLDLALKKQVEAQEDKNFPRELKGSQGLIWLYKNHNPGFSFGFLKGSRAVELVPLCFASGIAGAWTYLMGLRGRFMEKLALTLTLAGGISNVYDRMTRGYVVDYLRLPMKKGGHMRQKIRHVIFNIADLFIFLGGAFTALYSLLKK